MLADQASICKIVLLEEETNEKEQDNHEKYDPRSATSGKISKEKEGQNSSGGNRDKT